jgi:hypothetical protein
VKRSGRLNPGKPLAPGRGLSRKRAPLASNKPLRRKRPLRRVSGRPKPQKGAEGRGKRRPVSHIPGAVRRAARKRSGGYCERHAAHGKQIRAHHLHHRLPTARGGPSELWNLAHLCWACHRLVHATYERPWLLPGHVSRGRYVGGDLECIEALNVAA